MRLPVSERLGFVLSLATQRDWDECFAASVGVGTARQKNLYQSRVIIQRIYFIYYPLYLAQPIEYQAHYECSRLLFWLFPWSIANYRYWLTERFCIEARS